jgi:hypothetical protein
MTKSDRLATLVAFLLLFYFVLTAAEVQVQTAMRRGGSRPISPSCRSYCGKPKRGKPPIISAGAIHRWVSCLAIVFLFSGSWPSSLRR